MIPPFDLDKIRFATDEPIFQRAIGLYEKEKVTQFKANHFGSSAIC